MMLFKSVELEEGNDIQYLGAYILKWKNNICYKPTIGFIEATKEDLEKALENNDYSE